MRNAPLIEILYEGRILNNEQNKVEGGGGARR